MPTRMRDSEPEQVNLFEMVGNACRLYTDTPRSRATDPVTSHEAAEAIKASGELGRQQVAVLAAVRRWPGLTSLELGARMSIDRWAVARRLPELEPVHVRKGEPKTVNGRRHVTWWPSLQD